MVVYNLKKLEAFEYFCSLSVDYKLFNGVIRCTCIIKIIKNEYTQIFIYSNVCVYLHLHVLILNQYLSIILFVYCKTKLNHPERISATILSAVVT